MFNLNSLLPDVLVTVSGQLGKGTQQPGRFGRKLFTTFGHFVTNVRRVRLNVNERQTFEQFQHKISFSIRNFYRDLHTVSCFVCQKYPPFLRSSIAASLS